MFVLSNMRDLIRITFFLHSFSWVSIHLQTQAFVPFDFWIEIVLEKMKNKEFEEFWSANEFIVLCSFSIDQEFVNY